MLAAALIRAQEIRPSFKTLRSSCTKAKNWCGTISECCDGGRRPSSCSQACGEQWQIALGKQYAGRHVLAEEGEPGVWIVRTATVIPDNERWLHEGTAAADLQAAMEWSASHEPADADLTDTLTRLGHGQA